MEIKNFWVVTKPTPKSLLADICFETTPRGLAFQILGGLKPGEIHGMYTDGLEASEVATSLLIQRPTTEG